MSISPIRSHSRAPAVGAASNAQTQRGAWLVALGVGLLIGAYLMIGTLGHDPWKQDETYTFGIVSHMVATHDWIVPTNAGQPFMEKPPLYDWVAAAFESVFGAWLPAHDAARLASAFFTALTLGFTARAARVFHRASSWRDARVVGTVALLASTFVVIKHVHDLMTDVALLAGTSMAWYGLLACVRTFEADTPAADRTQALNRARRRAAAWTGAGVGVAMMSKGVFVPLVFGLAALAVPVVMPACRNRRYAFAALVACVVFAPFATIWPAALYARSPELFKLWFWDNNIGRFFGFSVARLGAENDQHGFVLRAWMTSALPVGPLALVSILARRAQGLRDPAYAITVLLVAIGMSVLSMSATARQLYLLPFTPMLALLASDAVPRLPSRVRIAWDYACRIVFASVIVAVWAVWLVMIGPSEHHAWLAVLSRWLPLDYALYTPSGVLALAVAITVAWAAALRVAATAGAWRGVVTWAAGVAAIWGLVFTLLLPWIDYSKSYRSVFEDLAATIGADWTSGDCMASVGLGESEAPMFEYFAGIAQHPIAPGAPTACRWLIVQIERGGAEPSVMGWRPVWQGARPGDDRQVLRVYTRGSRASG
ncbi:ArnT family glycosyltransferase [Pararobbsia silviterrae]|uniref:ArnT family glycosyltransferase n=1 Tax=Pararobbsia silviterrae TaxID=1792498 RepID=UPI001F0CCBCA|nr:glycosyl transferase [Pararobbsia silviterrae]